jgi:hypothetical protein
MEEIWKTHSEFPSYRFSNFGNVMNKLKQSVNPRVRPESCTIRLIDKNNENKYHHLDLLISQLFVPNPENKIRVHHKDNNRFNNSSDNLEWEMETESEIWKIHPDYPNYKISNFGNIRNKYDRNLKNISKEGNYKTIHLFNVNGVRKSWYIHRIVATLFIPNPENKETVNHIDHNPSNNHLSNLEWATVTEQNNHKRKTDIEHKQKIGNRSVWRLDKDCQTRLEKYDSIVLAAESVVKSGEYTDIISIRQHICTVARQRVISGGLRNLNAYGFGWEYDSDNKYEDEVWTKIPPEMIHNTKGYEISNYARIRNPKGRIGEGHIHLDGYRRVHILTKQYLIHRLMAQIFIPNPDNKEQVNHIDGNKVNALVSNLEWVSRSENIIHSYQNLRNK